MCIICVKTTGVAGPDKATLERCFKTNSDGAGFAWTQQGASKVSYVKGLMSFEAFWARYEALQIALGAEGFLAATVLTHFRIGTHGSKSDPKHTHPFPIAESYAEMEVLESAADAVMMHNGIYNIKGLAGTRTRTWAGATQAADAVLEPSDSMEFAKNILWPLKDRMQDAAVQNIIGALNEGCRLVVLDAGKCALYGNWVQDAGLYYSNSGFKDHTAAKTDTVAQRALWLYDDDFDLDRKRQDSTYWDEYFKSARKGLQHQGAASTTTKAKRPLLGKKTASAPKDSTFRGKVLERERRYRNEYAGLGGGYDRSSAERFVTWYEPATLTLKGKYSDAKITLRVDQPEVAVYMKASTQEVFIFDADFDNLDFVGIMLSWKYAKE